ncbi:type VI secretion system-associated protein TagF [Vibrio parahaemolyticus]
MSANLVTPEWGYIGKMPAKGDFVKDGISPEFANRWHDWQQAVIAVSKEQLGDTWNDYFLTAPVWHFALDVSYMDDATYIGSMIPSVDACGRYFFFTVVRAVKGKAAQYWAQSGWTEDSQALALSVLDDEFVFDAWHRSMQEKCELVSEVSICNEEMALLYQSPISTVFSFSTEAKQNTLLNHLIESQQRKPCFWWTEGSTHIESCMFVSTGLPSIGQFSAMLDGCWQKWSW